MFNNAAEFEIYEQLKKLGFRETRWQIIFDGQHAGVVFPFNHGMNEIHVRLYADRIFSELEFARSSIFHFLFPLFNANEYIAETLKGKISESSHDFLLARMQKPLLREEELSKPPWNHRSTHNPYLLLESRATWRISFLLSEVFEWRSLLCVCILGLPVVLPSVRGAIFVSILIPFVAIFAIGLIPANGEP